ncbi:hypothetical protein F4808DRAFT_421918 [Astrocystis sublimbata]|nr:hypothetical protein F4808DRAFT_421918 [Astrocystis sublimbata]
MFRLRASHGLGLSSLPTPSTQRSLFSTTCRRSIAGVSSASKYLDKSNLLANTPVAEQLLASGVWTPTHGPKGLKRSRAGKPSADKTRVNIVSEKLCDDILTYVGHSLERHRGCDILDIYPGAGCWSRKLNDFLQPRSHVLLEPDADMYRPFLQPLLDRPGTTLLPKTGIVWRELNSVLTPEYLPHQTVATDRHARNDTLLVTANLAFHPKKRFLSFESVTSLVLHQFVDAIRSSALFQRYGCVRMLIWARSDDKLMFVPRNLQRRRKQALDNDLLCEWTDEICGDESAASSWFMREDAINQASMVSTIERMRAAKIKLPAGRETEGFPEALAGVKAKKKWPVPGTHPPTFKKPFQNVLAELQATNAETGLVGGSTEWLSMQRYQWRANADAKKATQFIEQMGYLKTYQQLLSSGTATGEQLAAAKSAWETNLFGHGKSFKEEFLTYSHNLHAFHRPVPLLPWDRRRYEPMTVQLDEFFPNVACSLLDIQPKAPHPLMCETGPGSNRAADILDIILQSLMQQTTAPVGPNLDALWPGAKDYILPRWSSIKDFSRGAFCPDLRHAEPCARLLDTQQVEELIELWMEWPFRPKFHELLGRAQEDLSDKYEETTSADMEP